MHKQFFAPSICLLFLLTAASNVLASTPPSRINDLKQSILALDSAWTRAIDDLQQRKKTGSLEEPEKQDYAKFITYLSDRIDHYCTLLRTEGGEPAAANLPCAESTAINSGLEQPAPSTKTEQIAELDKSLTEALGEFDEQLLKEDQRLAARMPTERESGQGYAGGGGPVHAGQPGSGQQNGGAQTGATENNQGQQTSQTGTTGSQGDQGSAPSSSGAGSGVGSTQQKEDTRTGTQEISSGYDDIVARQLREAAEKETDPELKKKLWEEYRKYKEGIN